MEVWLDCRTHDSIGAIEGIDRIISGKEHGLEYLNISDGPSQSKARSMIGLVEWLVLDFDNWSMIPIENIVASAQGSNTRIAAIIKQPLQAQGAAFALQMGVDALLVEPQLIEPALIAKSQRGEKIETAEQISSEKPIQLCELTITEVSEGGVGDRVCVDLTQMLELGEGMLVSSTTQSMVLIHAETIESSFVPSRPFRVNAGAAQSYIRMADQSTKYLCELIAGDEVLIISTKGKCRTCTVGRVKIERRPFILFKWNDEKNNEGLTFIQQAETVRLIAPNHETIPVTELAIGDVILGLHDNQSRHIGKAVEGELLEK
jgi:3-dehydroquinate synthase II